MDLTGRGLPACHGDGRVPRRDSSFATQSVTAAHDAADEPAVAAQCSVTADDARALTKLDQRREN